MDQEVLVNEQKEDGETLLQTLVAHGFDVTVAFWAKISDGGMWYLFIATRSIESLTSAGSWRLLSEVLQKVRPSSISISDIRLMRPSEPSAIAAIDAVRGRTEWATRYVKPLLGDLVIDEAYIYPRPSEPMNRVGVVHQLARKMAEAEPSAPFLVVFKDGSRIYATPLRLEKTSDGLDVVLHDVDTGMDRSISADDVIAVHSGHRVPKLLEVILDQEQGLNPPR